MSAFFASLLSSLIFKAVSAVIAAVIAAISGWVLLRKQKAQRDDIQKGEDDLNKANDINDDQERLKEKADAACEIKKAVDPGSHC